MRIGGQTLTGRGQANPQRAAEERHGANSLASLSSARDLKLEW
jgi:hypothetical protein